MTKFRKLTALLLSAVLLVCSFTVIASADYNYTISNPDPITNGENRDLFLIRGNPWVLSFTTGDTGDVSFKLKCDGTVTSLTLYYENGKPVLEKGDITAEMQDTEGGGVYTDNYKKTGRLDLYWNSDTTVKEHFYRGTVIYHNLPAGKYFASFEYPENDLNKGIDREICTVTVGYPEKQPTITGFTILLKKGSSMTLGVLSDGGESGTIKWSSSKKSVASVSSKGVVKAKKKGTAVITAKLGNSTAKITIKVTA